MGAKEASKANTAVQWKYAFHKLGQALASWNTAAEADGADGATEKKDLRRYGVNLEVFQNSGRTNTRPNPNPPPATING